MQAVDNLHHHSNSMLQAVPASWSEAHAAPAAMDFTYDGVYNSFTPNAYTAFPAALSQTLCELDIDTSIHKLFEGLPEVLEDYSTGRDVMEALGRPAVTVASPFFPSTPPAHGSRPSSMGYMGSVPQAIGVTSVMQFLRPSQELATPVTVAADHRKGARARKGKGATARVRIDAKVPGSQTSGKKVLDAIVPSIQVSVPLPSAHVACVVPKILPATAIPAVDLSAVEASEHAAPAHPSQGPQGFLRMLKRSRKDAAQTANTRTQKTRYFDKVEHIVRERWRRDDMAGKFLALESLLPPSSKRDRSTIVEDSMKLVKSLQHRKEDALKRRAELKLAVASGWAHSPGVRLSGIIQMIGSVAVIPHANLHVLDQSGSPSSPSMVLSSAKRPLDALDSVPKRLTDCVTRFYVQSELATGDVVIEMICEQVANFHSMLLKSMEALGLEVIRCSVSKTINKLICNVTVKPFPFSPSVNLSSTSIMEGLSAAFRKV